MEENAAKAMRGKITAHAKSLGFDLVGFTKARVNAASVKAFHSWLEKEYDAGLWYMGEEGRREKREDIQKVLPEAKTVIALAVNYYHKQEPLRPRTGRVAKYAYGRDYHNVIGKWQEKLKGFVRGLAEEAGVKAYVDTGPVLERSMAQQAGLGAIGKNSCLITKEFGSWVLLAEIITTLDLLPGEAAIAEDKENPFSMCGDCTKCMDACPTGAIVAPGVIDARRCISYLTIENKGEIPDEFKKIIKKSKRGFGCDICQEVCPHNQLKAKETKHQELLQPKIAGDVLDAEEILAMGEEEFKERFAGSPLLRAKLTGLQRNMKVLLDEDTRKEKTSVSEKDPVLV